MMLATGFISDMLPVSGLAGIVVRTIVSLAITSIVFFALYHRNTYVKQSIKAVRKFIFKKEA